MTESFAALLDESLSTLDMQPGSIVSGEPSPLDQRFATDGIPRSHRCQPAKLINPRGGEQRRLAKIGIDRKAHKYRRAMPTACQNTSQLLRQRVILIHVEHLWIILSREVNNLRLSHFISTKGNPLIDLKVLEVIHASPHKSASPCACLSVSQHHNGRQMTAVADPHQIVRA